MFALCAETKIHHYTLLESRLHTNPYFLEDGFLHPLGTSEHI